ncbi:hypothetical protein HPB48_003071 [Haemaphysalis longicornis]|uniref:Uncharacterized protein n=1 Tax=Haemaphysalis longicornis TaxID=44386 RepID=A0A9J6FRD0_HAELO|nr:hypothetical protein HPB48_003071 [Haemaphysalis longicornis]
MLSTVYTDTTVASHPDAFMRGLTNLKQPQGNGKRLIVTQIGGEDGFVVHCLDIFRGFIALICSYEKQKKDIAVFGF